MLCTIWYHLYNLKNVKNTHGGVLLLVKLQAFVVTHLIWGTITVTVTVSQRDKKFRVTTFFSQKWEVFEYDTCSFTFWYGDDCRNLKSEEFAKLMNDFKQWSSSIPCTDLSEKYESSKLTPKWVLSNFQ